MKIVTFLSFFIVGLSHPVSFAGSNSCVELYNHMPSIVACEKKQAKKADLEKRITAREGIIKEVHDIMNKETSCNNLRNFLSVEHPRFIQAEEYTYSERKVKGIEEGSIVTREKRMIWCSEDKIRFYHIAQALPNINEMKQLWSPSADRELLCVKAAIEAITRGIDNDDSDILKAIKNIANGTCEESSNSEEKERTLGCLGYKKINKPNNYMCEIVATETSKCCATSSFGGSCGLGKKLASHTKAKRFANATLDALPTGLTFLKQYSQIRGNSKLLCQTRNLDAITNDAVEQQQDMCERAVHNCRDKCGFKKIQHSFSQCFKKVRSENLQSSTGVQKEIDHIEERAREIFLKVIEGKYVHAMVSSSKKTDTEEISKRMAEIKKMVNSEADISNIGSEMDRKICEATREWDEYNPYSEWQQDKKRAIKRSLISECRDPRSPFYYQSNNDLLDIPDGVTSTSGAFLNSTPSGSPDSNSLPADQTMGGDTEEGMDDDDFDYDPFYSTVGGQSDWNLGTDSGAGDLSGLGAQGSPGKGEDDGFNWPSYKKKTKDPTYYSGDKSIKNSGFKGYGKENKNRQAKVVAVKGKFDPKKYARRGLSSKTKHYTIFDKLTLRVGIYCRNNKNTCH